MLLMENRFRDRHPILPESHSISTRGMDLRQHQMANPHHCTSISQHATNQNEITSRQGRALRRDGGQPLGNPSEVRVFLLFFPGVPLFATTLRHSNRPKCECSSSFSPVFLCLLLLVRLRITTFVRSGRNRPDNELAPMYTSYYPCVIQKTSS